MESSLVFTKKIELPKCSEYALLVTINRPTQLNCFNTEVACELARIFANVANDKNGEYDDTVAVIFTGSGDSFCAGADLSNPPNPLEQSSDLHENLLNNPVYQMSKIQIPIIGALKGYVITGGFELALACDILVGDETTKFRDTHCKFGLAPCWGLSQKLQRRIGPGRAKLISFSAMPVNAKKAYDWGLIDALVPVSKTSLDVAISIADSIGSQNQTMVKRYKRALEEGGAMDLSKGLQRERELGLAHYLEVINDGQTFQSASQFIENEGRPRIKSKL
jgi:enoyl-CoA hydratase/carnithine racemase